MTLGLRIQALRKELGLSQEELGEKLGVARQSVSKWEADATIPELDKLIALSRLFGVSVGTLLGIEEGEVPDRELTDRELAALEAIAQRLTPPQDQGQPGPEPAPAKKRRRWPYGVAVIVVLVAGWLLMDRISRLENQLGNLQYNVSNIQNTVSREIGSISSQVRDILEEQNSITAGKDYTIREMDLSENTVTFSLTATPREYREGMMAVFSAAGPGFEAVEVPGVLGPGQSFTAELTCPLADDITLSVGFISGGVTVNQEMGREYFLLNGTKIQFYGSLGWTISSLSGLTNLNVSIHGVGAGQYKTAEQDWVELKPVKGSLRLWKNDTLVWSQEREEIGQGTKIDGLAIPTEGLELAPGDKLLLSVLYTDTAGRELEAYLDGCVMGEDGIHMDRTAPIQRVPNGGVRYYPWE